MSCSLGGKTEDRLFLHFSIVFGMEAKVDSLTHLPNSKAGAIRPDADIDHIANRRTLIAFCFRAWRNLNPGSRVPRLHEKQAQPTNQPNKRHAAQHNDSPHGNALTLPRTPGRTS